MSVTIISNRNWPRQYSGPVLWSLGKPWSRQSLQTPAVVLHTPSSPRGATPQTAPPASALADPRTASEHTQAQIHRKWTVGISYGPKTLEDICNMSTTAHMWDLNPKRLQYRSDSFWNYVTSLLLQIGQLLRVHTAGETGLQGVK